MSEELWHPETEQDKQQPDAMGAGRAERSDPERSAGERSGARPRDSAFRAFSVYNRRRRQSAFSQSSHCLKIWDASIWRA
jgi:hypothetical protein